MRLVDLGGRIDTSFPASLLCEFSKTFARLVWRVEFENLDAEIVWTDALLPHSSALGFTTDFTQVFFKAGSDKTSKYLFVFLKWCYSGRIVEDFGDLLDPRVLVELAERIEADQFREAVKKHTFIGQDIVIGANAVNEAD